MADFMRGIVRKFTLRAEGDRLGPLYFALTLFVAVSTLTRTVLAIVYHEQIADSLAAVAGAFLIGLILDGFVALCLGIPFALFLVLVPDRWLAARSTKWLVGGVYFTHLFVLFYLAVAEIVFFGEFNARFNFVSVDYLLHPKEVLSNIRDTYPVGKVILGDLMASLAVFVVVRRRLFASLMAPLAWSARGRFAVLYAAPLVAGSAFLSITTAQVSDNRVVNELAVNGVYSFAYALFNNEVDYLSHYASIDERRALVRTHELIATPNARFLTPEDPYAIDREIRGSGHPRPMNVVWILEESMGSLYVPSLHPEGPGPMRELDAIARDGLFFTRIYATGNRTVRGIEASLTSLPPLPGRSVVKRASGTNLFTLASLFREKGYQTSFIYGGRAYFDNIRDFALNNGYERVVDQNDFKKVSFTTVWGVCDEDLFDNALAELDAMHASGKPFFTTLLTVSNHTPFTYPKGRIPENPDEQRREHAMRYADHALGKFLREARTHAFFDDTVFVILGDHGARVYGRQEIPIRSYEIPVLVYAPKLIPKGRRIDTLGSQMDIAPTLLGVLDFDYHSQFFGRDLLRVPPGRNWALMSHNRDVALYNGQHMVTLGVRKGVDLWEQMSGSEDFRRLPLDADRDLVEDAIAYYQSAATLYEQRRFHPLAQPGSVAPAQLKAWRDIRRAS